MRGVFRAIGAMMRAIARATRTIFVICARTGAWIAKTVVEPAASGGGDTHASAGSVEQNATDNLGRVKRLAVALAIEHAPAEVFEDVSDQIIAWLGAMDKKMLCRLACASDADLEAHLSGRYTMCNVLVFDERAIEDYRTAVRLERDSSLTWFRQADVSRGMITDRQLQNDSIIGRPLSSGYGPS